MSFSEFEDSYVEALVWSSTADDENGECAPLDSLDWDWSAEALAETRTDCQSFYDSFVALWQGAGWDDAQAGHDFALTRNRHGAGFWDRGKGADGEILTAGCRPYGPADLYIGDDGKLYLC